MSLISEFVQYYLRGRKGGGGKLTRKLPHKDFTRSHYIEIAHIHTPPHEALRAKQRGARMHEHASVILVEELDGPSLGIEFHSAGDGGRVFLLRELDARELRIEGTCYESADEGVVGVVGVQLGGGG